MPENDLKLICDSLPCSYSADLSTQAHNIYEAITGISTEFIINGGSKPTLFAPVLTQQGPNITVTTNSNNGGWAAQVVNTLFLDDVEIPVSTQLTPSDSGKTLLCVSSHSDFNDATSSLEVYVSDGTSGFTSNGVLSFPLTLDNTRDYYLYVLGSNPDNAQSFVTAPNNNTDYNKVEISFDGGATWELLCTSTATRCCNLYYVTSTYSPIPPDLDKIRVRVLYTSSSTRETYFNIGTSVLRCIAFNGTLKSGISTDTWVKVGANSNIQITPSTVSDDAADLTYPTLHVYTDNTYDNWYRQLTFRLIRLDTYAIVTSTINNHSVPFGSYVEVEWDFQGTMPY